jgi:hypothetical protein
MRDVLKNLIDGLSEAWVKIGKYWRIPCKSAITQARQRLGAGVMRQLFHQLVQPMATSETVGAFLNGLRIVVIDGTCLVLCHTNFAWWQAEGQRGGGAGVKRTCTNLSSAPLLPCSSADLHPAILGWRTTRYPR